MSSLFKEAIYYLDFKDVNRVDELKKLLSEEELKKANRFLKNRDKESYIISHAFLRILLTHYSPHIEPKDWIFEKNQYGKPFLAKKHQIKLYFNLSHTYSHVAIILSTLGECGIDIEEDRGLILDNNLIDLVLTKKEREIYYLDKKRETFYIFWTLKEAYLKAEGLGFTIPPNEVDFSFFDREKSLVKDGYLYGTKLISENIYLSYVLKGIRKEFKLALFKFNLNKNVTVP